MRFLSVAICTAMIGMPVLASAQSATGPITKQQARYDAMAAGYANVSHLKSDGKGDWMGSGTNKGDFMVTPTGKVVPR
ncbi:hypothetical protein Acid7E03_43630 [Acidisoma sp. 7E03]